MLFIRNTSKVKYQKIFQVNPQAKTNDTDINPKDNRIGYYYS